MVTLVGVVGFYVLYPMLLILLNSFNIAPIGQPAVYSLHAWVEAWSARGLFRALWNTLEVAFWYQALSFPIGVLLAWVLARTNVPWAHALEFLFWLSFFLPAISTTLGWILLLDPRVGIVNQLVVKTFGVSQGPFDIFSFSGIIWVHLMSHSVSAKVMLLTSAFRNMDTAFEETSRMSGASIWTTFLRVTLPVMTPVLVIVFMLGLVRLFESFEIELLLGVPFGFYVYSTRILDLVRDVPPQLSYASALGSVTLVLLLTAAPIQRLLTTRRSFTTVSGRMRPTRIQLGRWRWPVFAMVLMLGAMLVLVPVTAVVLASFMTRFGFFSLAQTWTLENWSRTLGDSAFDGALRNTLTLAAGAAILGAFVFSLAAYVVVRAKNVWGRGLLDFILWMPSVVPGALTGLGLLWMFLGTPFFRPLYGTQFLLLLAVLMGTLTLSTQVLKASFMQLGNELEEGSRMSGATWFGTYVRIVLPLMAPTLIMVGTLQFLFAVNATSSIIMLATSETRTLSLLTLDYLSEGLRESAAVITVIITVLTTGVALAARALGFNLSGRG